MEVFNLAEELEKERKKNKELEDRIDSAINYIQSASRFELEYDKKIRVVSKYEEEYILREKDIYKILKGE